MPALLAERADGNATDAGPVLTAARFVRHLRSRGAQVRNRRSYWLVQCPAHHDREPSLSVRSGHRQPVAFKCFAGCSPDEVLAAAGLSWSAILYRTGTESLVVLGLAPCGHEHSPNFEKDVLHLSRCIARMSGGRVRLDPEPPQEERDYIGDDGELFVVRAPGGARQVMRAVLADFVDVVNERHARGELRAVPYGSRWAADRLGLDDRRVREALARLVNAGVLIEKGTLERKDGKRYGGTPLYALGVECRCPLDLSEARS